MTAHDRFGGSDVTDSDAPQAVPIEKHALTPGRWVPYFTVHGDPFVVPESRQFPTSALATVSTAPSDYGRRNAVLMAAAPDLLAALQEVFAAIDRFVEDRNLYALSCHCDGYSPARKLLAGLLAECVESTGNIASDDAEPVTNRPAAPTDSTRP